ncbi:N-acetyltransferase, putative [Plasmodium gallinaceum]|uniref:N-acetyltransferase, putative n=1 Tax=Plasmodium gallinaceum TaxID=5849 RepID=A0A1J1GTR1_PLAGA|nr:N-acetyltransferase, putative [Plasmodium gallinaceum]CRG95874.1 N-acetyltransferase, putative [Plasmodium gallinaceum]
MNLFKQKQNVTNSISHVLINKQKGKSPEPIITIRQLEEKDINEVRQLLYDHFNSLTLPAVIYWSIQHIYDLLVIIVINYIFFLDLKKIFYFLIIFLIYLYIRAKLEFLNHIRKDCPDLENLYKSYINVEGCNFWVAEVYDSNYGSGSRTTCSDIHEREKVMFEQEDEQGKLLNNEKGGNLNEKNDACENIEASKDFNELVNNNLNKDFKNKSNINNNEIEEQHKNVNNSKKNNTEENISDNKNDTVNNMNNIENNINNFLNKGENVNNNKNTNFEINNKSHSENYVLDYDKKNNINICKNDNIKDHINNDLVKDIYNNIGAEVNNQSKCNNNSNNYDKSNIKENNDNVLNKYDNLNNMLHSKNSIYKNDEDVNRNIHGNFENANNNKYELKENIKENYIINSNDKEEKNNNETNDNNGCNNNNTKTFHINDENKNNNNNERNLNEVNNLKNKIELKDNNEKSDVTFLKNDNLNNGKSKMLCDIRDFSKKQLIVNKRNVQSGLNEIKKKILNNKINEDEDFNLRFLNKKIVGCVGIVPFKGDNSIAQLVRMVVKKDNRRMRIGSRLLTQLENFAHEQNYQELKVFTNNLNTDSLYFVKQNGFNLSQIVRRGLMRGDLLIWSKILNKDDFYKFNSPDIQSYTNNILD